MELNQPIVKSKYSIYLAIMSICGTMTLAWSSAALFNIGNWLTPEEYRNQSIILKIFLSYMIFCSITVLPMTWLSLNLEVSSLGISRPRTWWFPLIKPIKWCDVLSIKDVGSGIEIVYRYPVSRIFRGTNILTDVMNNGLEIKKAVIEAAYWSNSEIIFMGNILEKYGTSPLGIFNRENSRPEVIF